MATDETQNDDTATSARTVRLTLEGEGIRVERSVDENTALQILATLMGSHGVITPTPHHRVATGGDPGSGAGAPGRVAAQSLREYLDAVEPKRNVERIVAIATYLTTQRGMDVFSREDVRKGFREASEPVPGNYGRDFGWAMSAGWVAPTEVRGEYYVTKTGKDAVEAKFPADVRKTSGVAKTRRRRAKPKASDE